MSGSDRNERLASAMKWGGGLLTLLVSYAVVWMISAQEAENATYAERNAHYYTEASRDEIERACFAKPRSEIAECIARVVKASEEAQRAEYDLNAQRDMAEWATWMVIVSAIGTAFSGLGMFFVWRSLNLNRAAVDAAVASNKIAREMGEAQARAYLSVKNASVIFSGAQKPCEVRFIVQNTGASPAQKVRRSIWVEVQHEQIGIKRGLLPNNATELSIGAGLSQEFNGKSANCPQPNCTRAHFVHIWLQLDFLDVFGRDQRNEFQFFAEYKTHGTSAMQFPEQKQNETNT